MHRPYIPATGWVPKVSREEARRHPCPRCGAAPGQHCRNACEAIRVANHAERVGVILQARYTKARAEMDAIPAEAWNFAHAYLENLGRSPVVTGLTPREEGIGNRAMTSMDYGRHLLLQHHAEQKSFADIAVGWGRTEESIDRLYSDALTRFASRLAPLIPGSCATCRRQMPEIVSNQCLRCPECRQWLENLWRGHSLVTAARTPADPAQLLDSYETLQVPLGASLAAIRAARDEQLDRLVWATSDGVPAHIRAAAAAAQTRINAAWAYIQRHPPAHGI